MRTCCCFSVYASLVFTSPVFINFTFDGWFFRVGCALSLLEGLENTRSALGFLSVSATVLSRGCQSGVDFSERPNILPLATHLKSGNPRNQPRNNASRMPCLFHAKLAVIDIVIITFSACCSVTAQRPASPIGAGHEDPPLFYGSPLTQPDSTTRSLLSSDRNRIVSVLHIHHNNNRDATIPDMVAAYSLFVVAVALVASTVSSDDSVIGRRGRSGESLLPQPPCCSPQPTICKMIVARSAIVSTKLNAGATIF
jgi:hypothetical protein